MALAFKLIMGMSAITSVMVIAATERGPATVDAPLVAQESFDERFPFLIVTPKQNSERAAQPQPAHASAEIKARRTHGKPRTSCRRDYYYIKKHRYWRCRR
jgi:hypothetical protein